MVILSKKQQANIERVWELEAQQGQNMIEMVEATKELRTQRKTRQAEIDAIENQVPDSSEDAWQRENERHPTFATPENREAWMKAYAFIRELLD